jgi:deazaflavin-dependent oxidoreductase (nitroreductase family)
VSETLESNKLEPIKNEKLIYLTTFGRKSGKAHTVELWFASHNGRIFLSHEGNFTDWMKNLKSNNRVMVRIGSLKFDANATIASDGEPREIGKRALYEKYYGSASKEKVDDWFELSTVVELTPLT